jgi:flagellar FliL protein
MAKGEEAVAGAAGTTERSAGLLGFIIAMLVATVVAGVGGGIFGMYGLGTTVTEVGKKSEPPPERAKTPFAPGQNVRALSPIVTNLAGPRGTWIRLEAAIVVDSAAASEESMLAAKIAEDIMAFLRTVPLAQIEGANGFQHLREDLNDRVRARSGGNVRELIIQSMIVE